MEPNTCPLCQVRVSNWMMAGGKTEIVRGDVVHKSCLIDYQLRTGKDFREEPKAS